MSTTPEERSAMTCSCELCGSCSKVVTRVIDGKPWCDRCGPGSWERNVARSLSADLLAARLRELGWTCTPPAVIAQRLVMFMPNPETGAGFPVAQIVRAEHGTFVTMQRTGSSSLDTSAHRLLHAGLEMIRAAPSIDALPSSIGPHFYMFDPNNQLAEMCHG